MSEYWENEIEIVKECGYISKDIIQWISPVAYNKIEILMKRFENTEWLAYLIGNDNIITDLYIPVQRVTSASVVDINKPSSLKSIGVIHSHHNMNNSFSQTDDDWINQNNDISLCVSKRGFGNLNIQGHKRIKLPCGKYILASLTLKIKTIVNFDEVGFLEEINDRIKETIFVNRYEPFEGCSEEMAENINNLHHIYPEPVDVIDGDEKELNFEDQTIEEEQRLMDIVNEIKED